jgi:hypothetical protein
LNFVLAGGMQATQRATPPVQTDALGKDNKEAVADGRKRAIEQPEEAKRAPITGMLA